MFQGVLASETDLRNRVLDSTPEVALSDFIVMPHIDTAELIPEQRVGWMNLRKILLHAAQPKSSCAVCRGGIPQATNHDDVNI
jgi:hypothetical protein